MTGQRNARADIEMAGFIESGHARATRTARPGCAALLLMLPGCAGPYSALEPHGPAAAHIAGLWWAMLAGAVLILTGVMAVVLYSLKRNRRGRELSEKKMLIGWGLAFPLVTLGTLMAFAFLRGEGLLARHDPATPAYTAHARQWMWSFEYPDGRQSDGVLHVKAGETFHVAVSSEDVIHSFWVPQLGGKIDAIPGRVNRIALRADAPGRYHGLCAEYCGIGHALMPFAIEAHPPERYAAALDAATTAPPELGFPVPDRDRNPAGAMVGGIYDYVLRWLGVRE